MMARNISWQNLKLLALCNILQLQVQIMPKIKLSNALKFLIYQVCFY